MKFCIKNFFSKYGQIRKKLWIWSHLLKKFLMQNFFGQWKCKQMILLIFNFMPMSNMTRFMGHM